MYEQLNLIFKRILPLRKSDGGKDILVMLGDYVDRRPGAHKVLDLIIDVQKQFPTQTVFLKGNHEVMLLDAIKQDFNSDNYLFWMKNGGEQTLQGYIERADKNIDNPYTILRQRVPSFIPAEHINFLRSLPYYWEFESWIFVHAGCDPYSPLSKQDFSVLIEDDSLMNTILKSFPKGALPWEKTIVTGHNGSKTGEPYIRDKFMMLDVSSKSRLLVVELRSGKMFIANKGKHRLVGRNAQR